jgi:hypothetical protein
VKTKIRTCVLGLAGTCGYAIRQARRPARFLPELAGLGLVSWGVGMELNPAAGVIATGLSLILAGSRIPRRPSGDSADR